MTNIHEILKSYGLEIPADKKTEFDTVVRENYKTVAEVEKIKDKLTKATNELNETKDELENVNKSFEELKESKASAEEWEKKYNDLVEDNRVKAEERARAELEAQEREEFDKYFSDNQKEWNNPFIADGYFKKYQEAKSNDANKGKMTADILHDLTKDDATAFKTLQPLVKLKGASGGFGGDADTKPIPQII